jgi:hypothetical protein
MRPIGAIGSTIIDRMARDPSDELPRIQLVHAVRAVETEFALIVQDDGWVLSTDNRHDDCLQYDYLGAPIHLAHVDAPDGARWVRQFEWCKDMGRPGYTVTPVLNGRFSLGSQRLMRALVEHPDIRVSIPPPDLVAGDPLRMYWRNDVLLMTCNYRVCPARLGGEGFAFSVPGRCREVCHRTCGSGPSRHGCIEHLRPSLEASKADKHPTAHHPLHDFAC